MIINGEEQFCTSWQWLHHYHRIPKEDALPHKRRFEIYVGFGDYKIAVWYYYYEHETVPVDTEMYEKLKALYIDKFGGWEQIDLEHTEYNGAKWW